MRTVPITLVCDIWNPSSYTSCRKFTVFARPHVAPFPITYISLAIILFLQLFISVFVVSIYQKTYNKLIYMVFILHQSCTDVLRSSTKHLATVNYDQRTHWYMFQLCRGGEVCWYMVCRDKNWSCWSEAMARQLLHVHVHFEMFPQQNVSGGCLRPTHWGMLLRGQCRTASVAQNRTSLNTCHEGDSLSQARFYAILLFNMEWVFIAQHCGFTNSFAHTT